MNFPNFMKYNFFVLDQIEVFPDFPLSFQFSITHLQRLFRHGTNTAREFVLKIFDFPTEFFMLGFPYCLLLLH